MAKHTLSDLYQMQSLPLRHKITMTKKRIEGWYDAFDGQVYVSFSGGKDSTVLVDIVTEMGLTDVPIVFVDTGLEYPEIREFVKSYGDRVTWLKPKMNFRQVIEKYGYPMISKEVSQTIAEVRSYIQKHDGNPEGFYRWKKLCGEAIDKKTGKPSQYNIPQYKFLVDSPYNISHKCCGIMKKNPTKEYGKQTGRQPITAQMASESRLRQTEWLKHGCNAFDKQRPISNPMSFWTEQDVLEYIKTFHLPICSVYGDIVTDYDATDDIEGQMRFDDLTPDLWSDELQQPKLKTTGCNRTGCMFCGFGCHLEKEGEGRFERMKETHPKQYEWIMKSWSEGGLGYKDVIDWLNDNGNLNIRY